MYGVKDGELDAIWLTLAAMFLSRRLHLVCFYTGKRGDALNFTSFPSSIEVLFLPYAFG